MKKIRLLIGLIIVIHIQTADAGGFTIGPVNDVALNSNDGQIRFAIGTVHISTDIPIDLSMSCTELTLPGAVGIPVACKMEVSDGSGVYSAGNNTIVQRVPPEQSTYSADVKFKVVTPSIVVNALHKAGTYSATLTLTVNATP